MFIPLAHAAPAAPAPGFDASSLIMFGVIFAMFWFLMIRPQMKQAKERQKRIDELQKGDEILTNSGLLGRVTAIEDQYMTLQIAADVEVQMLKSAMQMNLPKDTLKF